MKTNLSNYLSIFITLLLLGSCASSKKIKYFHKENQPSIDSIATAFEPKIQVGDLLYINITATNAEAALPFNLYETPMLGNRGTTASKPLPYLVDVDGNINFPVLGLLNIQGLTTKELRKTLEEKLVEYIIDPIINIRFANYRISVLGEVKNPGAFPVLNERMSVVEAITLAGDLTVYGERESVLLIRTENGKKDYIHLDLTQKDLFNSPYFYLKQNDVIYVSPNKTKVNASAVGPNTSVIISSVSILLTVIGLLL